MSLKWVGRMLSDSGGAVFRVNFRESDLETNGAAGPIGVSRSQRRAWPCFAVYSRGFVWRRLPNLGDRPAPV